MADAVGAEPPAQEFLLPCAVCGRTFRPESLQKHSRVCERNATKKRKIFDSSKQRIQGTELAEFLPALHMQQAKKVEKCRAAARQKSQWKEKHQEFMHAIRAARQVEKPLSPRASAVLTRPPESERCPHCDRHFGPKAFDRHIEWCREQKARVPKSPASVKAKERLEARLKYRAPVIRRVSIREKYSPQAQRKMSDTSVHNSTDITKSKSRTSSAVPPNPGQQDTSPPRQNLLSLDTQCNRSNGTNTRSRLSVKKISDRSESDVKKSPSIGIKSAISERKQTSSQTNKTKAKKEEKTIINHQQGISRGKRPATSTTSSKPAESSKPAPQPNKTEKDNAHSQRTIPCQEHPVLTGDITSAIQVLALDIHGDYIQSPNIERFHSVNCKSDVHIKSVNVVDNNQRKVNEHVISDETTIQSTTDGSENEYYVLNSPSLENKNEGKSNVDTGSHIQIKYETAFNCNGSKVNDSAMLPMTFIESKTNEDTDHLHLDIQENISEYSNLQLPCSVNNKSDVQIKCGTPVNCDGNKVNDSAILPMIPVEAEVNVDTNYLHFEINEQSSEHPNLQSLSFVNCKSDLQTKCETPVDCIRSKVIDSTITPMTNVQYKNSITDTQQSDLQSYSSEYETEAQKIVNIDSLNSDIHEVYSTPPNIELCKSFSSDQNVQVNCKAPLECNGRKLNDSAAMTHIQVKAYAGETHNSESYSSFSGNEKEVQRNYECSYHSDFSSPLLAPTTSIGSYGVTEISTAKPEEKMCIAEELPNIFFESDTLSVTSGDILNSQEKLNIYNETEYLNINAENYMEQSTSLIDSEDSNKGLTVSTIAVESNCESKDKNVLSDNVYDHEKSQEKVLHGVSVEERHHDVLNTISMKNPSSMVKECDMNTPVNAIQEEEVDSVNTFSKVSSYHYTDSQVPVSDSSENLTHNELRSSEIKSHKYQLVRHRSVPDLSLKSSILHFKKSKSFTNYSSMRDLIGIAPDILKYSSQCVKNDNHIYSSISKDNGCSCIYTNKSGDNKSNRTDTRKCVISFKNKHIFNRPTKKNIGLLKRKYGLPASSHNNIKNNINKIVRVMQGEQNTTVRKGRNIHLFNVNKIKWLDKMFPNWNVVLKINTRQYKDLGCNQESCLKLHESSNVHSENNTIADMDKLEILMVQQRKETITDEEASTGLSLSCHNNRHLSDEKELVSNRKHSEVFYTSVSNRDNEKTNYRNFITLEEEKFEINMTYQGHINQNDNNDNDRESKDQETCFSTVSQNGDTVYAVTVSKDLYENNLSIVHFPGNEMEINQNHSPLLMADNVEKESEYSSKVNNSHVTQTKNCENIMIRSKVSGITGQNKHCIISPRDDKIPFKNDKYDCATDITHDSLLKSNKGESELQQLHTVQSDCELYPQSEDSSFHKNSYMLEMTEKCMASEEHNESHLHSTDDTNRVFTDDVFSMESHSNTSLFQSKSLLSDIINANEWTDYFKVPSAEENDCKISFVQLCHNVNTQENEHRICLESVSQEEPNSKQLYNCSNKNSSTTEQQLMANKNVNNTSKASMNSFENHGKISDRESLDDGAVLFDEEKHMKHRPSLLPHLHPRQTERVKCESSQVIHHGKNKFKQENCDSSTCQDAEYSQPVHQDHYNESKTWKNEHKESKVSGNTEVASHFENEALCSASVPAELQLPKIITTRYRANSNKNVKELTIMEISKKHDKLKYDRNAFISKIPRHVPNTQCLNTAVRQQCFTQDKNMKPNKLPPLKRCSVEISRPDPNISTDTVSLSGSDSHVSRNLYSELDCKSESGEREKADEVLHHSSQIMNADDDIYCKENIINKQYSAKGKHSADSAYSSLNRQSPKQDVQEQDHCNTISSSGSESSLPTLCKEEELRPGTGDTVILSHNQDHKEEERQQKQQQPKFCHECGAQYPVSEAKFCCECGVRRLVI